MPSEREPIECVCGKPATWTDEPLEPRSISSNDWHCDDCVGGAPLQDGYERLRYDQYVATLIDHAIQARGDDP